MPSLKRINKYTRLYKKLLNRHSINGMLVMLRTPRNDVSAIYSKKKLLNRHSKMLVMLRTLRNDVSVESNYSTEHF